VRARSPCSAEGAPSIVEHLAHRCAPRRFQIARIAPIGCGDARLFPVLSNSFTQQIKMGSLAAGSPTALEGAGVAATGKPYYELVRDEIAGNIAAGKLWPGVVLLEGPIASLLGVSRGPVKRALELLAEDGLIRRFGGRGYLVGGPGSEAKPNRVNLLRLDLEISGDIQDYAQRATWQRIYGEVAESVVACTPFGAYQISELAMCAHFEVSRTVARDVLARLNHDGLIEKDRWSHWTAGPLTARNVQEHYEIRLLLESATLLRAAPLLDRREIEAMRARVAAARGASGDLDALERDLHETCLARVVNRRLIATINQDRLPDFINRLFAQHFGASGADALLDEHDAVFAELLNGDGEGAARALERHLGAALARTRARLDSRCCRFCRRRTSRLISRRFRTSPRKPSRRGQSGGRSPRNLAPRCGCSEGAKFCWSRSGGRQSRISASRSRSNSSTAPRKFVGR
jgi:DNA-binding GntR family transcriptional regulator